MQLGLYLIEQPKVCLVKLRSCVLKSYSLSFKLSLSESLFRTTSETNLPKVLVRKTKSVKNRQFIFIVNQLFILAYWIVLHIP